MPTTTWTDSTVRLGETSLLVSRAGSGRPVVVLHRDIGVPERLAFLDGLAQRYSVILPHHPGFARSPRPDWMRAVRDLAVLYQGLLAQEAVAAPVLVGLGFGGWIAAEMATMAPAAPGGLVLVGPMGLKPPGGDIFDQALVNYIEYARAGFHDAAAFDRVYGAEPTTDQLEAWDVCREMSFRIAWKPYMYSQTLPHLLGGVAAKALVVCGADDRIVPPSAAQAYAAKLPHSRLHSVPQCGACVEMEQPEVLLRLITEFIG